MMHIPCALLLASAIHIAGAARVADAATYPLPPHGVNIVGQVRVVRASEEDTLLDIGRHFGVGHDEIVKANPGVDRWLPGAGTPIILPTRYILPDAPRNGVVVNLPEMRLYYYPRRRKGQPPVVITHPVSVGRMDWATPLGTTRIVSKVRDPAWYPPASVRSEAEQSGKELPDRVPPGPDNPLGQFALRLAIPGYLIHGTNRPYGVGMRVTHGCIRMYPEDIESMFPEIPVGTKVHLVNQPVKATVLADTLFLEVHPALAELTVEESQALAEALAVAEDAAEISAEGIDKDRVSAVVRRASGTPEPVSQLQWLP